MNTLDLQGKGWNVWFLLVWVAPGFLFILQARLRPIKAGQAIKSPICSPYLFPLAPLLSAFTSSPSPEGLPLPTQEKKKKKEFTVVWHWGQSQLHLKRKESTDLSEVLERIREGTLRDNSHAVESHTAVTQLLFVAVDTLVLVVPLNNSESRSQILLGGAVISVTWS